MSLSSGSHVSRTVTRRAFPVCLKKKATMHSPLVVCHLDVELCIFFFFRRISLLYSRTASFFPFALLLCFEYLPFLYLPLSAALRYSLLPFPPLSTHTRLLIVRCTTFSCCRLCLLFLCRHRASLRRLPTPCPPPPSLLCPMHDSCARLLVCAGVRVARLYGRLRERTRKGCGSVLLVSGACTRWPDCFGACVVRTCWRHRSRG